MRFRAFDWDSANVDHLARHGVEPIDAEHVCRGEKAWVLRGREGRYLVYGRTSEGRYLLIVLSRREHGTARTLTARDMTHRERQLYERRR